MIRKIDKTFGRLQKVKESISKRKVKRENEKDISEISDELMNCNRSIVFEISKEY